LKFNANDDIQIAMARGSQMNIRVIAEKMSFREFAEFCSKPQKGEKHEAYFLRGVPEVEESYQSGSGKMYYDGRFRHDSSINCADFLIIDADHSDNSPSECHAILRSNDIVHFIYTTHSHTAEKNNFRVVIPCHVSCKANMPETAKKIIELFDGGIKYVKEMGTWSQAWFLPTRDNPEDGLFEHYYYSKGEVYEEVVGRDETSSDSTHNTDSSDTSGVTDHNSIDNVIETMREYKEGTHHAMRTYSYGMIQDGVPAKTVIETMRSIMHEHRSDSNRNETRYGEIERIVKGARVNDNNDCSIFGGDGEESNSNGSGVKGVEGGIGNGDSNDEEAQDGSGSIREGNEEGSRGREEIYGKQLAWPPGLMGELAKAVYEFSPYPNRTISIVTGLGLVAGIAGRRFNVSGNGLNLYITLLMDTGGGKSVISKFINRVLNDASLFTGANIFTGSGRYTGPKALMDDLNHKRCIVSVFTEAGFMFRSKSGDQDGLTRSILDLYGSSGYGCVSAGGSYSNDKNDIPAVASPCFSMINESTPDVFLETIRDGDKTGEINRMTVLRVEQEVFKLNRTMKYDISGKLMEKIKQLMTRCNVTQTKDDADVTNFRVTDEMYGFADEMKRTAWDCKEEDPIRFSMMQRSAEKVFKIASLLTVLNSSGIKGERELDIDQDAWDWARDFHTHEMEGLETFFNRDDDSDPFVLACSIVYPVVKKILTQGYKDRKMQPSSMQAKKNRFPLAMLRRALKNNRCVKALGNKNVSGIDRMIKWMKEEKYLKMVLDIQANVVEVNKSFLELGE